jgi:hypothetical protein
VTLPKKPRELGKDLLDLRAAAARIASEYGPPTTSPTASGAPATDRRQGKSSEGDPTSSSYATGGKARGLLRRCNSQVQIALRAIEAAEEALDRIYEQGWADVRAVQAGYLHLARKLSR